MAYKKSWINRDDLPPTARKMLLAFSAAFERPAFTITHLRKDAIFLQVNAILNAYLVTRFINSKPGFWVEFEAAAPKCWTVRMFNGEYYQDKECPRLQKYAQGQEQLCEPTDKNFRIKATTLQKFNEQRTVGECE